MKKPASRHKKIRLELSGKNGPSINLVPGRRAYLWIGGVACVGCVPDKDVQKLRDICNEILDRRELDSLTPAKPK